MSNLNWENAPGRTSAEKASYIIGYGSLHEPRQAVDDGPNPAFGAGIGNYAGWAAFFGTIGLILGGLATHSWIGAALGCLASLAIPTLITAMYRSSQRTGVAVPRAARRLPGGVLAWTVVAGLAGAVAGYGMAHALEVADEVESTVRAVLIVAGFGAALGLAIRLLIAVRRRRGAAKAA